MKMDVDMDDMEGDMNMGMNMGMNMPMPSQTFHLSTKLTLFFKNLNINRPGDFLAVCVVFMVVTILYEVLKCVRQIVAEKDDRTNGVYCFSKGHALQTFLFLVEFAMSYSLMLVVMTFNGWLFIAILVGSGIGYHTCQMVQGHRVVVVPQEGDTIQSPGRRYANKDLNGNDGLSKKLLKNENCERVSTV